MTASKHSLCAERSGAGSQSWRDRSHAVAGTRIGSIREIDQNLELLRRHSPYHESNHVLNIAFNILAGGEWIEHMHLRHNRDHSSMLWEPSASATQPTRGKSPFCEPMSSLSRDAIDQTRVMMLGRAPCPRSSRKRSRRRENCIRHRLRLAAAPRERPQAARDARPPWSPEDEYFDASIDAASIAVHRIAPSSDRAKVEGATLTRNNFEPPTSGG